MGDRESEAHTAECSGRNPLRGSPATGWLLAHKQRPQGCATDCPGLLGWPKSELQFRRLKENKKHRDRRPKPSSHRHHAQRMSQRASTVDAHLHEVDRSSAHALNLYLPQGGEQTLKNWTKRYECEPSESAEMTELKLRKNETRRRTGNY